MGAKIFAKLPELGFTSILEAKLEGMLGSVVIQFLNPRIGTKQLQTLAVRFPQEFDPRSQNYSIRSVLSIFTTHSTVGSQEKKYENKFLNLI